MTYEQLAKKLEGKEVPKEVLSLLGIKENKLGKPNYGDKFWSLDEWGRTCDYTWLDDEEDIELYEIGNCFHTEEDALFELERRKVLAQFKQLAQESGYIDWDNENVGKYLVTHNVDIDKINIDVHHFVKRQGATYFASIESLKNAIEVIGEEKIRTYLF